MSGAAKMELFTKAWKSEKVETDELEVIEKLCNRISNSTLLEDKKSAVVSLKSLSRDYQLVINYHNFRKWGLEEWAVL